jgi:hypothetical protein
MYTGNASVERRLERRLARCVALLDRLKIDLVTRPDHMATVPSLPEPDPGPELGDIFAVGTRQRKAKQHYRIVSF